MKIELDEKTLALMLRAAYLSNWMVNAFRLPADREPDSDGFAEQIYKIAWEAGFTDYCEYSEQEQKFTNTSELDDRMMPFINAYNEDFFWEELANRLGSRDAYKKFGQKTKSDHQNMIARQYKMEFDQHGLENLRLAWRKGSPVDLACSALPILSPRRTLTPPAAF